MKKIWIFAIIGVLLGLTVYLASPKRHLASETSESQKLEYVQIKTSMIQDVQWQDDGDAMTFRIESADPEFCTKWSQASVSLAAEGMGVSGEAPGAKSVANCQAGRIEMKWPKQVGQWQEPIQKTGDYIETPEKFYVSEIALNGSMGQMKISNYEISSVRSQQFELNTR